MGIGFVESFDSLHPLSFFSPAFTFADRINKSSAGVRLKSVSCSEFVRVGKSLSGIVRKISPLIYGGVRGLAAPLIRGASERRQSEAIADAKEQGWAG